MTKLSLALLMIAAALLQFWPIGLRNNNIRDFVLPCVLFLLTCCAPIAEIDGPRSLTRVFATCADEAERLSQPVVARAKPVIEASSLERLETGRFIYRCERRDEWLAIMFPARGERVDCATRSAEQRCAVGWINGDIDTEIFG